MALFNFLVNLVGLALWSNWLSSRVDPLAKTTAATLAGTLRRAPGVRTTGWQYLAGLGALLLVRAWVCVQIGSFAHWTPTLKFVLVMLSFRGNFPSHMLLFSLMSFGLMLAGFYLWLLLLSFCENREPGENSFVKFVRLHLGWLGRLPNAVKLLLPFALGSLVWLALHPLLSSMEIVPANRTTGQLLAQAVIMGAGTYLAWKYLIVGILLLYTLHSYVHLGEHPVWEYVDSSTRNLLRPLRWLPLRVGRFDLLPPVVLAAVLLLAISIDHPPEEVRRWLFRWLPF